MKERKRILRIAAVAAALAAPTVGGAIVESAQRPDIKFPPTIDDAQTALSCGPVKTPSESILGCVYNDGKIPTVVFVSDQTLYRKTDTTLLTVVGPDIKQVAITEQIENGGVPKVTEHPADDFNSGNISGGLITLAGIPDTITAKDIDGNTIGQERHLKQDVNLFLKKHPLILPPANS